MPEPITLVGFAGGLLGLSAHLARRYFDVAKEIFDIAAGVVLFALALPLLAACALTIRLCSRGPVIYRQVRVGKDGRLFEIYKLRSMHLNAEVASGATWAAADDPRIIPACRWMRHSHVDELPQLLNVVKGEMSLIGPRPERPEILAELEKAYPEVRRRLAVRPGITGLAQITNGYDTTVEAFRRKLESDLDYIERKNWGLEIQILLATVGKFNDRSAR